MPQTYESLATTTADGSAASVTFSSISGAYTDLVIVSQLRSTTTSAYTDIYLRFATGGGSIDTGNNYSTTRILGSGSSVSTDRIINTSLVYASPIPAANTTAGVYGTIIAQINNYSNSTANKTVLSRGGDASNFMGATIGLWRNTGSITSVQLLTNGTISSGSTFTLYGIKAA